MPSTDTHANGAPDDSALQIFTASCPSQPGTVDVITRYLYDGGYYINEIHSFDDTDKQRFFIRIEFRPAADRPFDRQAFVTEFARRAKPFAMDWQLHAKSTRAKVVIMVSRHDHCLNDLLYRYRTGQLAIDIPAIISNHPDLRPLAEWHGIPYHYLPISADTKPEQEAAVWQLIREADADLVVLARYMQVLSNELCAKLEGQAINIHHSLLPGFKGARPYHQAYDKGVKLVGATAHYVSPDLDEGPIIAQGVEPVDHTYYPNDLAATGKDIECLTLARAVAYHIEHRVFLHGDKTIVFPR